MKIHPLEIDQIRNTFKAIISTNGKTSKIKYNLLELLKRIISQFLRFKIPKKLLNYTLTVPMIALRASEAKNNYEVIMTS